MSVESHLRESMLKTALMHLLRNREKSPIRTARNIQELLNRFNSNHKKNLPQQEELLLRLKSDSNEECLKWIMERIS